MALEEMVCILNLLFSALSADAHTSVHICTIKGYAKRCTNLKQMYDEDGKCCGNYVISSKQILQIRSLHIAPHICQNSSTK